jgi:hypothetical protein
MGGDVGELYGGREDPELAEFGPWDLPGEFVEGEEDEGFTDMRSMSSFNRSLSQSTRPPF